MTGIQIHRPMHPATAVVQARPGVALHGGTSLPPGFRALHMKTPLSGNVIARLGQRPPRASAETQKLSAQALIGDHLMATDDRGAAVAEGAVRV